MLIWNSKITKKWLVIYTGARENRKIKTIVSGKGDSEIKHDKHQLKEFHVPLKN